MATSGSTSVTVTNWDTLKFTWTESSQSIASNTTTISWKMELIAGSSGRISATSTQDWSVTINGTTYTGSSNVGISNNSTKTLASGTAAISHNSDGTKTFSYSFSQYFGITFSGVWITTKSGSGTGTLDTIPRASTPTVSSSSVFMGDSVTITTNRASSSFTHDLAYSFAGAAYVSIATGVGASSSWTVPDLASSIPNATSGTLTIRCITKNGSTTVGTKTVTMTIKVPTSVVPTISGVTTEEAATGLSTFGAYIAGKSKIKTTITAAGAKGSTIKSYSTTFNGKTYTGASWTSDVVIYSGSINLVTTVTDSRGRTAKKTTTISVLAYSPPEINALQVYRVNAEGEADQDGIYLAVRYKYSVESLNSKNTASMVVEYKQSTATEWSSLLTGTATSADTTTKPTSPTFSTDYQYDFRLTVTDFFGSAAVYTAVLPSGAVVLDIAADGLGLGLFKTAEREGVDFGSSAKGAVLGLWEATSEVPENGDLNEYTRPGVYSIPSNAVAATVANIPAPLGGTLRVWSGLGAKKITGAYAYINQEFHCYDPDIPVYRRLLVSDETQAFTARQWVVSTKRVQRVLWSGVWYMSADHTAELSEYVSEQENGIVLVFSRYSDGALDQSIQSVFISKKEVELFPGNGHAISLISPSFAYFGTKYLYIHNDKITGHLTNTQAGTIGTTEAMYTNNAFVMRYVLGV